MGREIDLHSVCIVKQIEKRPQARTILHLQNYINHLWDLTLNMQFRHGAPYLKQAIDAFEKIQRRATKMISDRKGIKKA